MRNTYLLLAIISCVFFSCSTARYNEITSVNYNQRILGKGYGRPVEAPLAVNRPVTEEAVTAPVGEEVTNISQEQPHKVKYTQKVKVPEPEALNYTAATTAETREYSAAEVKTLKKQVKRALFKESIKSFFGGGSKAGPIGTALLIILAIFIPPLAVALDLGIGKEFWIDLLLTLLLWVPGIIYAIVVIVAKD